MPPHVECASSTDKGYPTLGGPSPKVLLVEFSRDPDSLRKVLLEALVLEPCRAALKSHKLDMELGNGAKILVRPAHHQPALAATKHLKLHPKHVLMDLDL